MAGLLLVELLAQAMAAWHASSLVPTRSGATSATRRILAVGDSNTFGLRVGRAESYPGQLAARLGDAAVTNAGYPGLNSSRVRAMLPALLADVHPTDVLILIGANDFWALPADHVEVRRPWWSHLRTARLVYQIWMSLRLRLRHHHPETHDAVLIGDAVYDLGWRTGYDKEWVGRLRSNIRAIVADVRAAGARPWLLTYASRNEVYAPPGAIVRRLAPEIGVPVIDVGEAMAARCGDCADLLFPDGHPNAAGYAIVADVVARALAADGVTGPGPRE